MTLCLVLLGWELSTFLLTSERGALGTELISMEDYYLRLKGQRNSLGHQLLLKLKFLESLF